jgi:hypothetical protein
MAERAKRPADAALDLGGNRRLTSIERHDGVAILQQFVV